MSAMLSVGFFKWPLCVAMGALGLVLVLGFTRRSRQGPIPKGPCLPPGPRGKPLFGNVFDIPTYHEWETYTKWAEEYGDMVHMVVFGQHVICVNSMEVARDLFEKRSTIYSDRFDAPMLNDLAGFGWSFSRMRYGQDWRQRRKAFHQHFHPTPTATYCGVQTKHTRDLLRRVRESPDKFIAHLRHLAGAIIMEVAYGIKVLPDGDPYIDIAEKAISAVGQAGLPGTFLVDLLPILKHMPEWMPGAGFLRKARTWKVSIEEMRHVPFVAVKKALSTGTAEPSVTASLLEDLAHRSDASQNGEAVIRDAVGAAYAAGSGTVVSALSSFILAMVLYPEVQRKAQAELDAVIGMDRLPVFDDRENLPYINALCKEVLRWHPVTPLAVAHRNIEDDVYGNYFIPRGSIIFGNAWAMLHDVATYGPQPKDFIPERFLEPGIPDPTVAFGFGRRICPGRYMAENTLFIGIASLLKVFDISHASDEHGNKVPVVPSFTSGSISHPEPYRCGITPRSAHAEVLIARGDN